MYFSLIEPAEGVVREAAYARLTGPYAEHQWLWRFFPAPEGTPRDFLFHRTNSSAAGQFYVVSRREPVSPDKSWAVRSRNYAPSLYEGQRLRFEVRVNPVVAARRNANGKGVRDDVVMHRKKTLLTEKGLSRWNDWQGPDKPAEYEVIGSACLDWLCGRRKDAPSRAESAGFRVIDGTMQANSYLQHSHRDSKTGNASDLNKAIQFSTVDLSGELEVVDPDIFCTTLYSGLGRGKAFGCGLLLVRPI